MSLNEDAIAINEDTIRYKLYYTWKWEMESE